MSPNFSLVRRISRALACWSVCSLVLTLRFVSPAALAWNESGHRVIAATAARQMSPELQAQILQLLRAHPRYKKDLVRYQPRRLKGLSEVEWLMGQAAQWPDRARRFNNEPRRKRDGLVGQYHRGNWHYINLPVYLEKSDRQLRIKDPARTVDADDPQNVLEALTFMRVALSDPATSDTDKGLWISWALHLIADVHQPLHTAALFSKDRWPRGDRGGNEVKIAGSGKRGRLDSLHYYWDSAISNVREPKEVNRLVGVLQAEKLAAPTAKDAAPVKWIREGRNVANRVVYDPLRTQLRESPTVRITNKYTRRAHAVALERGAIAARRTAIWLEAALQP